MRAGSNCGSCRRDACHRHCKRSGARVGESDVVDPSVARHCSRVTAAKKAINHVAGAHVAERCFCGRALISHSRSGPGGQAEIALPVAAFPAPCTSGPSSGLLDRAHAASMHAAARGTRRCAAFYSVGQDIADSRRATKVPILRSIDFSARPVELPSAGLSSLGAS
jgi:hypothetical protein